MSERRLLEKPKTNPEYLLEYLNNALNGIRRYYALLTALELGIFDLLSSPKTAVKLAKELKCDEKLISLFCEVLRELKFLKKTKKGYTCSEISRTFLTQDSFYSQTTFIKNTKKVVNLWLNLLKILKDGPIKGGAGNFFAKRAIHSLAQNCLLGELQKTVKIISNLSEFHNAKKLLDLGGGHGLYSIAFTMVNPKLKAYVFDLPHVVERTKDYIREFKAKRVYTIPGNFFLDNFGKNYDIVFSSYNPGGKKAELIPKIYNSLKKGGLYINKQIFPEKDQPLLDFEWNLWGFGIEKGKRLYTFKNDLTLKEYLEKLEKFKFKILDVIDMGLNNMSKMIIAKKI